MEQLKCEDIMEWTLIWKKTKVMKISRQPPQFTLWKQLENVEYFNYVGSMVTNTEIYTREIKSRIAIARAALNKTKTLYASKLVLNLRKKLVKRYIWCIALYGTKFVHFGK
jgi:hypothetical protein